MLEEWKVNSHHWLPKDRFFNSLKLLLCLLWVCLTSRRLSVTTMAGTKGRTLSACTLYLRDLSRAWLQSCFTHIQKNGHIKLFKFQHTSVLGLPDRLDNIVPSADWSTEWGTRCTWDIHRAAFLSESDSGQSGYDFQPTVTEDSESVSSHFPNPLLYDALRPNLQHHQEPWSL